MKEQRELAYQRVKEAQELAAHMDAKVRHYEEILTGHRPDDTNPATQKIARCNG